MRNCSDRNFRNLRGGGIPLRVVPCGQLPAGPRAAKSGRQAGNRQVERQPERARNAATLKTRAGLAGSVWHKPS